MRDLDLAFEVTGEVTKLTQRQYAHGIQFRCLCQKVSSNLFNLDLVHGTKNSASMVASFQEDEKQKALCVF